MSAASATAPLPEGVRAVDDFGLNSGGDDDGRRACDDVNRQRHGARRRPQRGRGGPPFGGRWASSGVRPRGRAAPPLSWAGSGVPRR